MRAMAIVLLLILGVSIPESPALSDCTARNDSGTTCSCSTSNCQTGSQCYCANGTGASSPTCECRRSSGGLFTPIPFPIREARGYVR
jgi:hypothetical protein